MPVQRDEPSAPLQAENDVCQRIVVALRVTGRLVPAFRRGMRLPYGVRAELLRSLIVMSPLTVSARQVPAEASEDGASTSPDTVSV